MAVSVLYDAASHRGCLVCTSTDGVFGPVFEGIADAGQLERFVEWILRAGIDPREEHAETILAEFTRFVSESSVETAIAFQCDHCLQNVAASEIHSSRAGGIAGVVRHESPCPRCGRGDGDFTEVEICAACKEPCEDRAAHVACAGACAEAARGVIRERKPPAESVRTVARLRKEA